MTFSFRNKVSLVLCGSLFALSSTAMAASTGPYLMLMGGAASVSEFQVTSTAINRTDITPFTHVYSLNYNYSNNQKTTMFGRIGGGYFFNYDPYQLQSFGVEADYNYFRNNSSTVTNQLVVPLVNVSHNVATNSTNKAWSANFDGVYARDVFMAGSTMLLKLGVGYEDVTKSASSTISDLPSTVLNGLSVKKSGVGISGGIGWQYAFTQSLSFRAEVDGLKGKSGISYGLGGLGLVWNFGTGQA